MPEGRLIFANLTVYENLKVGAYLRSDKDGIERDLKRVYEIFPRLEERKNQIAGTLSGGEQQMLAMGTPMFSSRAASPSPARAKNCSRTPPSRRPISARRLAEPNHKFWR